ncbi:hypothetical protein [Saccharothrix sp. Mg75]|uniref:hypothetical protein n=1 Tax=Saccharothrix sp. Mg75 TaxID=3445357 RepID=UPI003EED82F3
MPEQEKEPVAFRRGTVDRWQVYGGVAGVLSLLLTVLGGLADLVQPALVAAVAATLAGVVLLFRWGRDPGPLRFVLPVLLAVGGAVASGVLVRPGPPAAVGAGTTTPGTGSTTTSAAGRGSGEFRVQQGVILRRGQAVDLDARDADNAGIVHAPTSDTDLEHRDGLRARDLAPVAGRPGLHACAAVPSLTTHVPADRVGEGTAFCVRTSGGRWARVLVTSAAADAVEFDLVVWD